MVAIPDKETTTVAKELLDQWILRHGFYEQVISDHGGEFVSKVMDELNTLLKQKHHVVSPYSPHVNGQVERVHQTMGDYPKTPKPQNPRSARDFTAIIKREKYEYQPIAAKVVDHLEKGAKVTEAEPQGANEPQIRPV